MIKFEKGEFLKKNHESNYGGTSARLYVQHSALYAINFVVTLIRFELYVVIIIGYQNYAIMKLVCSVNIRFYHIDPPIDLVKPPPPWFYLNPQINPVLKDKQRLRLGLN